jgi:hypothetical protein
MIAMKEYVARRRSEIAASFAKTAPILMLLAAACGPTCESLARAAELRRFTVRDSIGLSYFVRPVLWTLNQDPPTEPIASPDGRHFLLVTQKGILATNKIEASIWIFGRQAVDAFLAAKSPEKPQPRKIASFAATSNTPVISDVRWLNDSRHVAFLGKRAEDNAQLYVADTTTSAVSQLTHAKFPVSAYDIRGSTIAYTTFDEIAGPNAMKDEFLDVTGETIWNLLWRIPSLKDRDESWLLAAPNTLHVIRRGRELTLPLRFKGHPLKLYFPILSLSPDEKSLATIAPVFDVPLTWKAYQARYGYEDIVMVPGGKTSPDPENNWKASQFVNIDLRTGVARPLIDAPAGRSVFQVFAPTKAIWSPDSESILLSNTFLPLMGVGSADDTERRSSPAAVTVNLTDHAVHLIAHFPQPARGSSPVQHVSDVTWNTATNTVEVRFASSPDNVSVPFRQTYRWTNSGWTYVKDVHDHQQFTLSIYQDLNRAPVLGGETPRHASDPVIWDPNPQLAGIALGKASLYEWSDKDGASRRGILVLPPDYIPGRRYPLVIQTHGFEPQKFFADGIYTTGSGGRALCGRGIIVLQTEQYSKSSDDRHDAEIEIEAFQSGIQKLAGDGLVDPKRVGVIGFSFTVYHALYAITHYPDLFAAASITDGNDLSYWLYLLWTDVPVAQEMAEAANGGVKPFGKEGLLKWQESAPGFNLDRTQSPLLISCLEKGTLVATWDIYGALRTLRKPVEMMWLTKEDAPHVLVQPRHRYLSQELAVDWFDFWLNEHEDPNPTKTGQYAKWRELRTLKDKQTAAH